MIEIDQLRFGYSTGFTLALDSLKVETGSRVAWIGSSGSGKTTLLHLAAGIDLPTSGRLTTGGTDFATINETQRREFRIANIGLIFQDFALLEYLSVLENILLPYRLSASLRREAETVEYARHLAAEIGLEPLMNRRPRQLSQGEQQRVAVCRALVVKPQLLLADEPTANLDPGNASRVLDALERDAKMRSATLVVVTHDHSELDRYDTVTDLSSDNCDSLAEDARPDA